jgi:hypothetical protein
MRARVLLIAEMQIAGIEPSVEIQDRLDAFREATLPSEQFGITLYRTNVSELPLEIAASPGGWATGLNESEVAGAR